MIRALLIALLSMLAASPAAAATRITLSGPQELGPIAPDAEGRFAFPGVVLRKNSVNVFKVTATDDFGQAVTREVRVTQLSLESIVVSRVTTLPLAPEQVQQLVNDGVITLDDPQNFNVSQFSIVLTIGREPVSISVPIAVPLGGGLQAGSEVFRLPGGDGSGGNPRIEPVEIVVFDQPVIDAPGQPGPLSIPGVIIIEGRIKSLKEFFSVRLLLMNVSGVFTLQDVRASLDFPDGGLAHTLPADGIVAIGDILPGTPEQPGQAEREFIIRGDEIGVRPVKVNFGGFVGGPGIPEDARIPFNGSATATVEVKGPPSFQVRVIHPPAVIQGVPYELTVEIANTGDTPALYASLDLDVGADARLVTCRIDEATGLPACEPIEGPSVRALGHVFPGQTVSETYLVDPLVSGPITSCMGLADQNIALQVLVGAIGCLTGRFPPAVGVPTGVPTVSVLPAPNALGVGIDAPVTAFFSKVMNLATITTGDGGAFNVRDDRGRVVPGQLRFETIGGRTVAIWQVNDGITNRLAPNTEFGVSITQDARDPQGNALFGAWSSRFTTTSPTDDRDPPAVTLSAEPPVDPNRVVPGQVVRLNAYAADQGTGVARVELRRMQVGVAGADFELIDQKTVTPASPGPCIFAVDSSRLVAGATYQFKATAYDRAGNAQDATLAVIVADSAAPPLIRLPDDAAQPVPQGLSVAIQPLEVSAGVRTVQYVLDGDPGTARTLALPPFQTAFPTAGLAPGPHHVRAVAVDGLGQSGEDTFVFTVEANPSRPVVSFGAAVDGASYVAGTRFTVAGTATDPVGVAAIEFFLDDAGGRLLAETSAPFTVDTTGLSLGSHRVLIRATNRLGRSNDLAHPDSILEFEVLPVPTGEPPDPPVLDPLAPPANGLVRIAGTSVPGARLHVTNATRALATSVDADTVGRFGVLLDAEPGDQIRVIAVDLRRSTQGSAPATVVVPPPPALVALEVAPGTLLLTAVNAFQDLVVTGRFSDGSSATLTAQAAYRSSNLAVASVGSGGRVVALASGQATITAEVGAVSAQAQTTVSIRRLVAITLDPAAVTLIGTGQQRQLTVVGRFSDETTGLVPAPVVFASSDFGVASVNGAGLVTSRGFGRATISAAVAGLPPAQATVTVEAPVPTGIAVSPGSLLFTAAGQTQDLAVSRTLSDGSLEANPSPLTFRSSNGEVVTVSDAGRVTAVANGDATITVEHLAFSATVPVTVDIPPALPPPVVTAIDRPRAGEGDPFVIRGRNFAAVPAQNRVTVNGLAAEVVSARQDELVALVPKGATTGPVVVTVDGQASNAVALAIYPRRARSLPVTSAIDAAGTAIDFGVPDVDVRAGDRLLLSSAPDVLAPLDFDGTLTGRVDGGSPFAIAPTGAAVELTSRFAPGVHALTLELADAGGALRTGPIFLIAGPDGTGPFVEQRSVAGVQHSRSVAVTFLDLPVPDGGKVAVTAGAHGFGDPVTNASIASDGGQIANGEGDSPDGFGLRVFTVRDGRIDVLYDPVTARALGTTEVGRAAIQVLPANAAGQRTGNRAIDVAFVALAALDTAAAPRSQSSAVADGVSKVVTVTVSGLRDGAGGPVPDGTVILVTAGAHGFGDPVTNAGVASAGGSIVSGEATAEGFGLRAHTVTNGRIVVQYDPGSLALAFPEVQTATLQVLPARPDRTRIGNRAFMVVPVTLSPPQPPGVALSAPSVLADTGDNRVVLTFSDIVDAGGTPVPDGTRLVFTAGSHGFGHPATNAAIASAGGVIVSGTPSPDGSGLQVHLVQGARVEVTYSAHGVGLGARQSATASIQGLPARANGSRIGNRAFALAEVRLTGYQTASASAVPTTAVADGLSKIVTVTLSSIRDTEGNLVPDGAAVVVTAGAHGFADPAGSSVSSAGGVIASGTASPDGFGLRKHVVSEGRVTVHYDPGAVLVAFPELATANVQVLPARPGDGGRIGDRAFAVVPITLSSARQADVVITPASVLADGADHRVVIAMRGIADVTGTEVPDDTTILATVGALGFRHPATNLPVASAGGAVTSGTASSDGFGLRAHETQGGDVEVTYSAEGVALEARRSDTARVQFLPGQPDGRRIGDRAFAVVDVTLAGFQSADVSGAGLLARDAESTYVVTDIRDTAGNPVPDGAAIAVTATASCFVDPETNACIGSAGGTIVNGEASSEGVGLRVFRVQGGAISVTFRAPATAGGTSVLQLLPARPANGNRIGNRAFATKAIAITP